MGVARIPMIEGSFVKPTVNPLGPPRNKGVLVKGGGKPPLNCAETGVGYIYDVKVLVRSLVANLASHA